MFKAQCVYAAGLGRWQAVFAEKREQFTAQQVLADQPGRQMRDTEPGEGAEQQGFRIVGTHAHAPGALQA
ncbi:hypothetical protein D9M71_139200 [compost metagenome]